MVFDARKLAADLPDDPFQFVGMDGETYELPNSSRLTGAQAQRFKDGDDSVLQDVADPDTYQAIMAMPVTLTENLAAAWIRHGRRGKEAGPSSPRPPRGKRSR